MASTQKTPAKLYVTAKDQGVGNAPLGFLNPYEQGKAAFLKRKQTQDTWAYCQWRAHTARIEEQPGGWVSIVEIPIWKGYGTPGPQLYETKIEPIKHPPQIWDNVPMTGFTVTDTISRFSTSNKFWRILDPRGVEFEISTACFEAIVKGGTVSKGIIQDPCIWIGSKNLILAP